MDESRKIILLLALGMSAITILAFIPLWTSSGIAEWSNSGIVVFFRDVCHQIPDRMFELNGSFPAICSRCSGIYSGFMIGLWATFATMSTTATLPRRPVIIAIVVVTAIIGLDITAQWVNLWDGSNTQRAVLGLLWSMVIVSIFLTRK